MNIKILLVLVYLFLSFGTKAQNIDKYFQDIQWAHYNGNINTFLQDGIGSALKGDVDPFYVDDKLGIKDYALHSIEGMLIETISVVNFEREANKSQFRLKFANGQEANFPEVIMYFADNYSNYYTGPDFNRPYLPHEILKVKDSCNLKESKRIILQEYWYFDVRDQKMKPFIRGMGIIDNAEKSNKQVVWIDMRYFDQAVFDRVNVVDEHGKTQNFSEYLTNRPFVLEDVEYGYSRFYDQVTYDTYNNEIDVYFELFSLKNQFDLSLPTLKIKKGKPVKTKFFKGELSDGQFNGKWQLRSDNGNLRAEFSFEKGTAQGEYSLYDSKGKLKEKGLLNNGLKHGEQFLYFSSGEKKGTKNYLNGKLEGSQILYFENGDTHSTFSYKNGYTHGDYISYNMDGSFKLKGEFKKGVIVGSWNFNLEVNSLMCGYLVDEMPQMGEIIGLNPKCMEDCMATFTYLFEEKEDINCFNGVCIMPKRIGDIE